MKIKVIKKAELESPGAKKKVRKTPKRRRIARAVEQWVEDVRAKTEAEEHISLDQLFQNPPGSQT